MPKKIFILIWALMVFGPSLSALEYVNLYVTADKRAGGYFRFEPNITGDKNMYPVKDGRYKFLVRKDWGVKIFLKDSNDPEGWTVLDRFLKPSQDVHLEIKKSRIFRENSFHAKWGDEISQDVRGIGYEPAHGKIVAKWKGEQEQEARKEESQAIEQKRYEQELTNRVNQIKSMSDAEIQRLNQSGAPMLNRSIAGYQLGEHRYSLVKKYIGTDTDPRHILHLNEFTLPPFNKDKTLRSVKIQLRNDKAMMISLEFNHFVNYEGVVKKLTKAYGWEMPQTQVLDSYTIYQYNWDAKIDGREVKIRYNYAVMKDGVIGATMFNTLDYFYLTEEGGRKNMPDL